MFRAIVNAGATRANMSTSFSGIIRGVPNRAFRASSAVLQRKILISDPIEQSCVDILTDAGYSVTLREKVPKDELIELCKNFDGLIVRSGTKVTADVIENSSLKMIGRAGTGVDNIDVAAATQRGAIVMNTPGGNTASAAELSVSLLMALVRNIPLANESMKAGRWDRKSFMGTEVAGKVLGVVGLGQIGRRVAAACQAMGMTVIGFDPMMSPEVAKQYNIQSVDLDTLYAQSDFITLHTPLTAKTKHLLNDKTLAKCKDGVRIVNCARGGIVDELALLRAIESGKVAGAALDVYESEPPPEHLAPVIAHPKIICTPHLGASTEEAQEKVAKEIANQFVDAFEGRKIAGVVNSPILSELHARKDLTPFVELTDRMGALQAQLLQGQRLRLMSLRLRGKSLQDTRGLLTTAALKGVLSNMVEKSVNFINAPSMYPTLLLHL
eukprot:TRINITY_DN2946_c0_g1_i4.p1 TRINITY_DN2946_c0_g1~~TRINITY_DN2946_c0_g1_i4.p1  ORF type:complete len:460 (+),score=96.10 TRINITY_DN2946_c0_g1_i4:63-1382(+)